MKASSSPPLKSQHLFQHIWAFALLVMILMFSASGSLYLLSAVRGFVNGESLWSKAQKDAIYALSRYADEGSQIDLARYQKAMLVPRGDAAARDALYQGPLNLETARKGIEQGQNHPDDVNSLIWLLRTFRYFDWIQEPVSYWKMGDEYLDQLETLSREIEQGYKSGAATPETIAVWKREIDLINQGVSALTRAFSDSLGNSSRHIVWILLTVHAILALALVGVWTWSTWRWIRQREQIQSGLDSEKERAETTLATLGDAVITTNAKGLINYINPAGIGLLGLQNQVFIGKPIKLILQFYSLDSSFSSEDLLYQFLAEARIVRDDQTHWVRRTDRSIIPVKVSGATMLRDGEASGALFVLRDVSREQQYMDQLSWNARHDALTGLENRGEFERRLQKLLTQGLHQVKPCALLYIDLDQFKLVNETCGYAAGEEVLREVARSLASNLRDTDYLARMGGDEFAVLLENCPPANVAPIAEKLRLAALQLQISWGDRTLHTGLSIGAVHISGDAFNASDLLRMADMACYQAKERGRNRVFFYTAEDGTYSRYVSEMEWVTRIRAALDEDRFCLYAQSIAYLQGAQRKGMHFEVLLRLKDEDQQILAPSHFIPAAERYGLMPSIDRWVIAKTLQTLALQPGYKQLVDTCSINLSGSSLDDDTLLEFIKAQMQQHDIAPHMLCFEITETSAIGNLSNAKRLIQALRALGCRFALDDFGVGMSSLTYLKQLPVDYLKIDGGFVRGILQDKGDYAMVEMINGIGQTLGKKTVAEFVESQEIAEALMRMGVDYAQGYAIAHPVPMTDEYFMRPKEEQLPEWCTPQAST